MNITLIEPDVYTINGFIKDYGLRKDYLAEQFQLSWYLIDKYGDVPLCDLPETVISLGSAANRPLKACFEKALRKHGVIK